MKLKRSLAILLALCMMLPLAACKGNGGTTTTTTAGDDTTVTTTAPDEGDIGDETTVIDTETTVATDEDGNEVTTTVATDEDGNEVTTTTTVATDNQGNTVKTTTTTTKKGDTTKKTTTTTKKGDTTKKTTTTKTKKTLYAVSTQTVKKDGESNTMGSISLKKGTTPLEKGLDFGGKTFRFAFYGSSIDADHDAWHKSFEKQYNVKLDIKCLATTEYTAQLSSAMASKEPYDIVFLYNFDYPSQIVANVMAPLDDYVTTADVWDSKKAEGFSYSLMEETSLNGHIYCVGGAYLQSPTVIWYNKLMFKNAGFSGSNDPLALYKSGKWTWEKLYDMLSEIQDPSKKLYGINTIAPYYHRQFITSFGTDFAKKTSDGRLVSNLNDSRLYNALEMLAKYHDNEHGVANPNDPFVNGVELFLNGTTASVIQTGGAFGTIYKSFNKSSYSAFGGKANQLSNLGVVPMPLQNAEKTYTIWDWMGYGAGNGATEEGIKCALAFAKHDAANNHNDAYVDGMPANIKSLMCEILDDTEHQRAPMSGFKTSAGNGIDCGISEAVAIKGQNITAVLKSYEKVLQTRLDAAMKG